MTRPQTSTAHTDTHTHTHTYTHTDRRQFEKGFSVIAFYLLTAWRATSGF